MRHYIILCIISSLLCQSSFGQSDCQRQINAANIYYSAGNYERAIEQLRLCDAYEDLSSNQKEAYELIRCKTALEYGKQLFDKGRLKEVTNLLEPCVDFKIYNRDTRVMREGILSLLAENLQFQDEPQQAEEVYYKLLYQEPFYQPESISQEIKYVANKYETFPFTAYTIYGGIYMLTRPIVDQRYSLEGVTILDEKYNRQTDDLRSWVAGINVDINLDNSNVFLTVGAALSSNYFRYRGDYANVLMDPDSGNGEDAMVSFFERQRWFQFPLMLKWMLAPKEKIITRFFIPYTYTGVTFDFLNRNSAQLQTPSITYSSDVDNPVIIENYNTADRRTSFAPSFLVGGGLKFHIHRFYFDVDLRYRLMMRNLAAEGQRFAETELTNTIKYVDNDFRLQNFGFTVGAGFFLFKSQKKVNSAN